MVTCSHHRSTTTAPIVSRCLAVLLSSCVTLILFHSSFPILASFRLARSPSLLLAFPYIFLFFSVPVCQYFSVFFSLSLSSFQYLSYFLPLSLVLLFLILLLFAFLSSLFLFVVSYPCLLTVLSLFSHLLISVSYIFPLISFQQQTIRPSSSLLSLFCFFYFPLLCTSSYLTLYRLLSIIISRSNSSFVYLILPLFFYSLSRTHLYFQLFFCSPLCLPLSVFLCLALSSSRSLPPQFFFRSISIYFTLFLFISLNPYFYLSHFVCLSVVFSTTNTNVLHYNLQKLLSISIIHNIFDSPLLVESAKYLKFLFYSVYIHRVLLSAHFCCYFSLFPK